MREIPVGRGGVFVAKVDDNVYGYLEEAARAYDEAAKIHHGEFARLNFPNG